MSWCRYHPESPSFLGPVAEGRITGPAGRYACCGQQAFRYETLPGPHVYPKNIHLENINIFNYLPLGLPVSRT